MQLRKHQYRGCQDQSGTEKGYDKTKEGGTVAADKTKETSVKAYDKSKEGVQKIADPSAEQKSKVTNKSRETNVKAKDDAKRTEQKAKDATPQSLNRRSLGETGCGRQLFTQNAFPTSKELVFLKVGFSESRLKLPRTPLMRWSAADLHIAVNDLVGGFKEDHRHADTSVGIDLGKTTFHLVALNRSRRGAVAEEVHSEAAHHLHREHADLFDRMEALVQALTGVPDLLYRLDC